jgi:anti-sigma-K factor RskA
MRYSDPRLVQHLAAAYVLGTLGGGARRRFHRLLRQRPDLALAVAQWEGRLGRLASVVPPATPSPRVWEAIAARTRPAAPTLPESAPRATRGWRWLPGVAAFGAGAAVAMALWLTLPGLLVTPDQVAMRTGERLPQSYVGLLTDARGDGKLLVSSLRHGRTLVVKAIGPMPAPAAGRQLVLWAVPGNGPPFALGTAPASGSAQSQLPDTSERLLAKVTKLVVTEEAAGALPAMPGVPLYTGNCAKLW